MLSAIKKIFGSQSDRAFKKSADATGEIVRFADSYQPLSDAELFAKTAEFKSLVRARVSALVENLEVVEERLRGDLEPHEREQFNDEFEDLEREIRRVEGVVLDELQAQAFGVVREACRRLVGRSWEGVAGPEEWFMMPYDVQLFGGIVLHQGKIAEMATGEGKTLVATMPLYLNALTGRGCHLITHNNYLAKRDAMWMGGVYNFLGLSVGVIQDARQTGGADAYLLPATETVPEDFVWQSASRKEAYAADITYATKDQVGFDYLYNNMATRREDLNQREFNFAIVDEADSNLIDDARTPLIISGPVPESTNRYAEFKPLVEKLIRAQTALVNKTIASAEKRRASDDPDEYEVGIELLRAIRGTPKNRRLMKILQEEGTKRLISRVEADYMRDKRLSEIDETLYYVVDERAHTIDLMDQGRDLLSPDEQALFVLPDLSEEIDAIRKDATLEEDERREREELAYRDHAYRTEAVHNINQLMKAYSLFEKDIQYLVTDDKRVVIVDESTGRPQPGRRFADGLHQALEAKEGVKVEQETQTVATITLQNLFRMYQKLAGMTGTAETEAHELWEIYKLDVVVIPTHRPIRRVDHEDQIYRTKREKYNAMIEDVAALHEQRLPVLVGTVSVEASELLSRMLTRRGIKHQLLNARYHEKEAQVVSEAGQPGAVTIATNMAGRGTDIKLNPEIVRVDRDIVESAMTLDDRHGGSTLRQQLEETPGGLQVVGTERHESRRIDRQLRGRSGRQGDPGSSRFYLSLEDDLMRLFGSERIASVMDRLGAEEGEVIEHSMVTRSIERAQKKVEARNFDMRKHLLEYDDVMNQQRQVIYNRRRDILERDSAREQVLEIIEETVDGLVVSHLFEDTHPEEWPWEDLAEEVSGAFFTSLPVSVEERSTATRESVREALLQSVMEAYEIRVNVVGEETFREIEKSLLLHTVDTCWQEHLYEMDELKEGVGFVGVGGKNPLIEYKKGAFDMFEQLLDRVNRETLRNLLRLRVEVDPRTLGARQQTGRYSSIHREATNLGFSSSPAATPPDGQGGDLLPGQAKAPRDRGLVAAGPAGAEAGEAKEPVRVEPKVGRNEACPCGSGKKYKRCCGRTT
jgi:preprotein translocase subunit SecA